jgi:hypothetical protein
MALARSSSFASIQASYVALSRQLERVESHVCSARPKRTRNSKHPTALASSLSAHSLTPDIDRESSSSRVKTNTEVSSVRKWGSKRSQQADNFGAGGDTRSGTVSSGNGSSKLRTGMRSSALGSLDDEVNGGKLLSRRPSLPHRERAQKQQKPKKPVVWINLYVTHTLIN